MLTEQQEFVEHDGVFIHVNKMVEMAKNAGSYNVAEHYIVSLLVHAHRYDMPMIFVEINSIRMHYHLQPFASINGPASGNNMPNFEQPRMRQSEIVQKTYRQLSQEQKESVLKEALVKLHLEEKKLFERKTFWIGVYLVVRDRLDQDLKAAAFCRYKLTPDGWTNALVATSLSNIGRYIEGDDKELAYYQMTNNPFKHLCEKYWSTLQSLILTKKPGAK